MGLEISITTSLPDSRAVTKFFRAIEEAGENIKDPILSLTFTDPKVAAAWEAIKRRPIAKISLHFREELLVRLREISYEMPVEDAEPPYDVYLRRVDMSSFCNQLGLRSPNVARALTAMTAFNYKPRREPPEYFGAVAKNLRDDVNLTELVDVCHQPQFKQDFLALTSTGRLSLNAVLEFAQAIQDCGLVKVMS